MALLTTINVGTSANDGTGDPLRSAFTKINTNYNITQGIIAQNSSNVFVTGTTANTLLTSFYLQPNTFKTLDDINIDNIMFTKTGVGTTCGYRIYINSTNSLTGATQIGYYNTTNTNTFVQMSRKFFINAGTLNGYPFASTDSDGTGASTSAMGSVSFNVANGYYLIIAVQPNATADVVTFKHIKITN